MLQYSPARVRLKWQAPFSHHGHEILYYTILCRNKTYIIANTSLSFELALDNEEYYSSTCEIHFSLKATNDIGESEWENSTTSILKGTPHHACSVYNIIPDNGIVRYDLFFSVPTALNFRVDGNISSQNDISTIELHIQVTVIRSNHNKEVQQSCNYNYVISCF